MSEAVEVAIAYALLARATQFANNGRRHVLLGCRLLTQRRLRIRFPGPPLGLESSDGSPLSGHFCESD